MSYRRGFKSDANAIAAEVRTELGLSTLDPMDPWRLADHLDIPVWALSQLDHDARQAVRYLKHCEPDAFSAVTVFRGTRRTIVHNDSHSDGRQASNVAHELAHGLLHHRPAAAMDDLGCRAWDQGIEDEAQWLAGALLIPEDAALWIVKEQLPEAAAANRFGVTPPMVRFRVNVTGARSRIARAHRLRVV